jgi:hypothetical protein
MKKTRTVWLLRAAAVCTAFGAVANAAVPATGRSDPFKGGSANQDWHPDTDQAIPGPSHPPFEMIPAMPMPSPKDVKFLEPQVGKRGTTWHNALTGETIEMPDRAPSGLPGGSGGDAYRGVDWMEGSNEQAGGFTPRTFGSMGVAGGLNAWPAAPNVKLVMRFVDQSAINRYFVCSGAMHDPGVVQTAAHCVYARNPNGINIFNWASEIWVYPGWDGLGNTTLDEVFNNFGYAKGYTFMAGTNYINSGDFNSDAGAVRVTDRSVGSLTGWLGWTWGFDCAWAQGHPYFNYSYPAEGCGGGLHTGNTMYFLSGFMDYCFGNQMGFNTSPGCTTAIWGGQSGSNLYWNNGGALQAHAVCSNSDRAFNGNYCKLWETWVNDLETFKTNTRGFGLDIESLRFRTTGTSVQAGTSGVPANVLMLNATNGDPGSQTYTVNVYLSTNNQISSGDTLLATWFYNVDFAAMQGVNFNVPASFIPSSTPPGTYFIGCTVSAPGDVDGSNNQTNTWDCQQITVLPAPPSNDTCGTAISMTANSSFFGNSATAATNNTQSCGSANGKDVWFAFTPACTDTYTFDTCGSGFDTVLSVHSACPNSTANEVVCNDDDFNAHCSGSIRDSWASAVLTGGTTYYICVAGYQSASGNYAFHIGGPTPLNNDCTSPEAAYEGSFFFSNCGATTDGPSEPASCNFFGEPNVHSDVWFSYSPSASGTVTIDTCPTGFDTELALYYGYSCPSVSGTVLACSDDNCNIRQSLVSAHVDLGVPYLIRIGGYNGTQGSGIFNINLVPDPPACVADVDDGSGTGTPDGGVTIDDLIYYLSLFENGDIGADVDDGSGTGTPDGGVTIDDLIYYLTRFEAGC